MKESTTPPGLCARCGRDPADDGVRIGVDWYCNTSTQPCAAKHVATRQFFPVTAWSDRIKALLGERPR